MASSVRTPPGDSSMGRRAELVQQPLSLLTIDRNHQRSRPAKQQDPNSARRRPQANEDADQHQHQHQRPDLLTVRILEASERKLQFIRELLGPQEWESLVAAAQGAAGPLSLGGAALVGASESSDSDAPASRAGEQVVGPPSGQQEPTTGRVVVVVDSSARLEAGGRVGGAHSKTHSTNRRLDLQARLAKRREAIDFFFANDDQQQQQQQQDTSAGQANGLHNSQTQLAMELRSGYYLSSQLADLEQNLVQSRPFSLRDRLDGLLGLLGLSTSWWSKFAPEQTGDGGGGEDEQKSPGQRAPEVDDFLARRRLQLASCRPYASPRNVAALRSRLQADGHYQRLGAAATTEPADRLAMRTLKEMRRSTRRCDEMGGLQRGDGHNLGMLEPRIGHFNGIQLRLPSRLHLADSRLLVPPAGGPESFLSKLLAFPRHSTTAKQLPAGSFDDDDDGRRRRLRLNGGLLRLELDSFRLLQHGLMSAEELAEARLVQAHADYARLWRTMRKLDARVARYLRSMTGKESSEQQNYSSTAALLGAALRLLRFRSAFQRQVLASQQRLVVAAWNELQAARAELLGCRGRSSTRSRLVAVLAGGGHRQPTDELRALVGRLISELTSAATPALARQADGEPLLGELGRLAGELESTRPVELALAEEAASEEEAAHLDPQSAAATGQLDEPEARRRADLASLMGGLRFRLLVTVPDGHATRSYSVDLRRPAGSTTTRAHTTAVDLSSMEPIDVLLTDVGPVHVELQLLLCGPQKFPGQRASRLLARGQFTVIARRGQARAQRQRHKLELEFGAAALELGREDQPANQLGGQLGSTLASPTSSRAVVELRTSLGQVEGRAGRARESSHLWSAQQRELVDHLHGQLFAGQHPFQDTGTKVAQLLNQVDGGLLLAFFRPFGELRASSLRLAYFQLEPHCGPLLAAAAGGGQAASLRLDLLAWRWANQLDSGPRVYLSDRENQRHSLVALAAGREREEDGDDDDDDSRRQQQAAGVDGELRAKLRAQSVRLELGYKSVEALRACAPDHVRQCELNIERRLELEASQLGPGGGASTAGRQLGRHCRQAHWRASDLLLEPQLGRLAVDVGSLARQLAWWLLKPRRTARRPLMPRKRPAGNRWRLAAATRQQAPALGLLLATPAGSPGARKLDLEAQTMAHWHKFAAGQGQRRRSASLAAAASAAPPPSKANLQLVVTVQQASNVPMRVLAASQHPQQHQQQLVFRSESPFGGFGGPQQALLLPPTTYVELVFQRRQLATSLAQGKHPAWNETLFFPVDWCGSQAPPNPAALLEEPQQGGAEPPAEGQLADECLQLNLYDCRCYQSSLQAAPFAGAAAAASGGPPDALQHQPLPANRLLAVSQRIERHLIGSLRFPLAGLLASSGGRVEGSFPLNQPLLLDASYQFEPDLMLAARRPAPPAANLQQPPDHHHHQRPSSRTTHLSLLVTLDPPPPPPLPGGLLAGELAPATLWAALGSVEQEPVFEYARLWEQVMLGWREHLFLGRRRRTRTLGGGGGDPQQLSQSGRGRPMLGSRHVRALVLRGRDAKFCLASRYLRATRPPEELLVGPRPRPESGGQPAAGSHQEQERPASLEEQMSRVARFVGLLSPLKYGLFARRPLAQSLWFDSAELLERRLGGPEEQAVLLCNYFAHLGQCCGLLLGDSAPLGGRCVLVIVWRTAVGGGRLAAADERTLELQVSSLMEQLERVGAAAGGGGGGGNSPADTTAAAASRLRPAPVEPASFVARLPILVGPKTVQIWEPSTGRCHSLLELAGGGRGGDRGHPLPPISVGSIVTMENVYANAQASELPAELNFDIRLKHFWAPLFELQASGGPGGGRGDGASPRGPSLADTRRLHKKLLQQTSWRKQLAQLEALRRSLGHPLKSPVAGQRPSFPPVRDSAPTAIRYETFTRHQCEELKQALDRAIRSHLLAWRPSRPTYFNRTLSRLLADKLATFEQTAALQAVAGSEQAPDWRTQLSELIRDEVLTSVAPGSGGGSGGGLSGPEVISWPANLPFTSLRSILDALFASGVHNADLLLDNQQGGGGGGGQHQGRIHTQFLVACHVEAYPARVLSVWLYVGAIVAQPPPPPPPTPGTASASDGLTSNNLLI